ncbi:GNAT family N-acetyltransferase [Deinococcus radiomollis]|uniref:GNAT family N-acetyltransferase n=1 Tax=Deinococcus radiomollis TaxID=468916 RepID=UPI0038926B60
MTPSTFGPYTFDHAMPDTLADHMHFQHTLQHTQNPDDIRARLADGRTSYQHLCQMHSARGLEATWANGAGAGRIVVPHIRDGLEGSGLDALARHLAATAADKRLILDGERAPMQDAPWLAAGWVLDVHSAGASIDLSARTWPTDPRVHERPASDLLAPDLLELYAELVTVGKIGDTGETDPAVAFENDLQDEEKRLFVLTESGAVLGAALLTPAPPGRGRGIHMLGVRPSCRGQGLGLALHAHLLAVAAQTHSKHGSRQGGGTNWDNHPMRRIFERNGAVLTEQKQFIRP